MTDITLWRNDDSRLLPLTVREPEDIVPFAIQLTKRQQEQIVQAFNSGQFDLVSSFVWRKSLSSLKMQLGKLGMSFIGEMLDRPDIDDFSSIDQKLTDYDALRLAEELGVVSKTGAFRLRQSLEHLNHFESLEGDEAEDNPITALDAINTIRACVDNILKLDKVEAAVDFKNFRDSLESRLFNEEDREIEILRQCPYFFYRASVRILLALVKTTSGAQLENVLGNANLIIPMLWSDLKAPEKWQVGRCYSEMYSEGRNASASGLKRVLLKVKGFDFVPEDLRSTSFIKAARAILEAHDGINNFYNEPAPIRALDQMGSTIPVPAFAACMSAVLAVKLGNYYGVSFGAQEYADAILHRVAKDRWVYYLDQCLPTDERILFKLVNTTSSSRWMDLVRQYSLADLAEAVSSREIKALLLSNQGTVARHAANLATALGYRAT